MPAQFKTRVNLQVKCPHCGATFSASLGGEVDTVVGTCSGCGTPFKKTVPHLSRKISEKMEAAAQDVLHHAPADAGTTTATETTAGESTMPDDYGTMQYPGAADRQRRAAQSLAKALNIAGGIIGVWTWLYPHPYQLVIALCLLVQAVALVVVARSRGGILLADDPKSGLPHVLIAIVAPSIALGMRALADFNIEHYSNFWLPFAAITLFLILVTFRFGLDRRHRKGVWAAMLLFLFFDGFGITGMWNVLFDHSRKHDYDVTVLHKRSSSSTSSNSYYLAVSRWGNNPLGEEVPVSARLYGETNVRGHVLIVEKQGYLHIPWYIVLPARHHR